MKQSEELFEGGGPIIFDELPPEAGIAESEKTFDVLSSTRKHTSLISGNVIWIQNAGKRNINNKFGDIQCQ